MKREIKKSKESIKKKVTKKKDNLSDKVLEFLKKLFNNKRNVIIALIIFFVLLAIIIIVNFIPRHNDNNNGGDNDKISIDATENVETDDVQKLFSNMINISCNGDWYLDIKADSGKTDASSLKKKVLLNYVFSYLSKNNLLDKVDKKLINETANDLFLEKIDLYDDIDNFEFGDYVYSSNGGRVNKSAKKCVKDRVYVDYLYGYSSDSEYMSMDVNVAYLSDGVLYDFADNKLGNYSGNREELDSLLLNSASFYRFNYAIKNDKYKLASVELNSRV